MGDRSELKIGVEDDAIVVLNKVLNVGAGLAMSVIGSLERGGGRVDRVAGAAARAALLVVSQFMDPLDDDRGETPEV